MMENTTTSPLTDNDIAIIETEIKKENGKYGKMIMFSVLLGGALSFIPSRHKPHNSLYDGMGISAPLIIIPGFFIVFILQSWYKSRKLNDDKNGGIKKITHYTIAEKVSKWGPMEQFYKIKNRSGIKVKLPFEELNKNNYKVGDVIEVAYLPKSNFLLSATLVS